MAHTPGPWRVSLQGIDDMGGVVSRIATITMSKFRLGLAADDRALIEAAPELLAALKMAVRFLEHPEVLAITNQMAFRGRGLVDKIHATITQAEGREEP